LEGQIKHLILTGNFEVGSRLPSIRAMAGFLRVNRNTVARVFSDLERAGYVESRRGSGVYVIEPPVEAEDLRRQEVLERVMDLAAAQGVPVDDLAYALLARAGAKPQKKTPILFVECTRVELDQFSSELEEQLPVEVERVLLEDLAGRVSDAEDLPWRLAVTTFFHIHEVQDIVEPHGIEAVALLESLQRLMELPSGTPVGVVGWGRTCMDNTSRSIEGAGLDHLNFVQLYIDEEFEEVLASLGRVESVVCASVTARRLRELGIPEDLEIIEVDRILDQGGIEMLGRMLRQRL
jgi:DNA-binding transcriptional regulator YhcF (GntR family)